MLIVTHEDVRDVLQVTRYHKDQKMITKCVQDQELSLGPSDLIQLFSDLAPSIYSSNDGCQKNPYHDEFVLMTIYP